ncbi:accessory Sec system glycosyltransferase GtfA [Streptococcus iniae]|uniref:accessory Sec system glycosyltransferase GtfA n=1 Tax=Streptococcus iniae TaxID=1346 RepID=UPI000EF6E09A|nr:accessory Sec system glycosyltransferase GtfA [Streptococcus iniae]RLV28326.1 accessory Sec system glycosyltransferase GtfA [Streptococcus iniae]
MTIYNINLGIGWASSGVEYAQAYRASVLREQGIPAKFIFTDMFQSENLQHFTSNIGFKDHEIIWLYGFFTDIKVAPTTYSKAELEKSFPSPISKIENNGRLVRYYFENQDYYVNATLCGQENKAVQRVEHVSKGKLIRKDYYSYTKVFSEYYAPSNDKPHLYQRTFFNEDGSLAYEEIVMENRSIFQFSDEICYSKDDLVAYMLKQLHLSHQDIILLDRATGIGQAVLQHRGAAKLAVVIHAEHFSVNGTDDDNILWNNYYDYQFTNADKIDAFIASTEKQKTVLEQQFKKYNHMEPRVYAIPVGSLDELKYPSQARKPFSLLTGSRLAGEKHIDWLVSAVILAHDKLPELTFDIYGEGGERSKLGELIQKGSAQNYISLKGHQDLRDIYQNYQVYLTASTSEGFGLTLMEAVGSGLPLIGLDVPYGNQTFVEDGKNGYLIPRQEPDDSKQMAKAFAEKIIQYFQDMDKEKAQEYSYSKAENFLYDHLAKLWKSFMEEMTHDNSI